MSRRKRLSLFLGLCAATVLAACAPQGTGGPVAQGPAQTPGTTGQAIAGDLAVARRALASGDAVLAKRAFTAAMRKDPSNPEVVLGMAEAHLALAELDAAGQLFDVLAAKAPGLLARVRQGQGLVALRTGRDDRAITLLGEAVQRDGGLWRAWLGLGQAHDRQGQANAARRAFAAAERNAPRQAAVQNDIGMTYLSEKQPKKALGFFQAALRIDPGFQVARANVRIAHAMVGDYDNAIAGAPERGIADVLNNVGYVAILNRDFEVADRLLRRALEVSPTYHQAAVANLDLLARMADGGSTYAPAPVASNADPRQGPETAQADDSIRSQTRAEAVAALALEASSNRPGWPERAATTGRGASSGQADGSAAASRRSAASVDTGAENTGRAFRWADEGQATAGATASGRLNGAAPDLTATSAASSEPPSPSSPGGATREFRWQQASASDLRRETKAPTEAAQRLQPITKRVELGRTSADRLLSGTSDTSGDVDRRFTWSDPAASGRAETRPAPAAEQPGNTFQQQARMEDDGFLWID